MNLATYLKAGYPGIAIVTSIAPDTDASGNPVPSSAAFTCGLLDLRNPTAPLYGINGPAAPLWNPPMSHETSWTADNLGMLFGSEIDADGDMYVAAGGLYPASYIGNFYRRYGNLGGGATSLTTPSTTVVWLGAAGSAGAAPSDCWMNCATRPRRPDWVSRATSFIQR